MKININCDCQVELTAYGIEIMQKNDHIMTEYNFNPSTHVVSTQLWCLMNTFGEVMYNGGRQVFEESNIHIPESQIWPE